MQHYPKCNEDYKDKEDESNNNCLLHKDEHFIFFPPLQIILDEENTTLFQKNINISVYLFSMH